MVALLILGSAISLLSCNSAPTSQPYNPETLITMEGDTVTMAQRENGRLKYAMKAPLMESYGMAREPYTEYRKGIYVETYQDSVEIIQSTLRADYAINNEKLQVWRAQGNVVATGENGRILYTEQLFWNEKTRRIYSNVTSTVIEGEDIFVGERFESDDKFENWIFLNYTGKVTVEMEEQGNPSVPDEVIDPEKSDSTATKSLPETRKTDSLTIPKSPAPLKLQDQQLLSPPEQKDVREK